VWGVSVSYIEESGLCLGLGEGKMGGGGGGGGGGGVTHQVDPGLIRTLRKRRAPGL